MCRFCIYQGPSLPVAHLLISSTHSLRKQSYACRERRTADNEDGYGIGWYQRGDRPNLLHGELPAHKDPVFESAARSIASPCFFGHVRAATKGMHISLNNCHPFAHGRLLWMHNGMISGYDRLEPRLREFTRDTGYRLRGSTDSEGSFALFLKLLKESGDGPLEDMKRAVAGTVRQLDQWRLEAGLEETHYLNFAVTDGLHVVATRVFQPGIFPLTLYLWRGDAAEIASWAGSNETIEGPAVIVASEALQDGSSGWEAVPVNHMVAFRPGHLEIVALH